MDRIAMLNEILSQAPDDAFARYGLAMEYSIIFKNLATNLRRDSCRSGKSVALPDAYPVRSDACQAHPCPTYLLRCPGLSGYPKIF